MNQTKKVYKIGPEQQLLDLNGNLTNFEASFKVETRPPKPFDIAVVDQTAVDNNEEFAYESITTGVSSGTVKQDKNIHQNFYIAIRASEPCECIVEISIHPIEGIVNNAELEHITHHAPIPQSSGKKSNWLLYLLLAGIVGGFAFYMFVYKTKPVVAPKTDSGGLPNHVQRVSFLPPKPALNPVPKPVAPRPDVPRPDVPRPVVSRPVVSRPVAPRPIVKPTVPKPDVAPVAPKPDVRPVSSSSSSVRSDTKNSNTLLERLKRLNV